MLDHDIYVLQQINVAQHVAADGDDVGVLAFGDGADLIRNFHRNRRPVVGTDSGIPMNFHSQTTWRELDAWVNEFGIDPMVALRAATYWPSVAMRVSGQVGTLSEGKYADIIAVRGDVLRHINLLQNVDIVIKHGTRYR